MFYYKNKKKQPAWKEKFLSRPLFYGCPKRQGRLEKLVSWVMKGGFLHFFMGVGIQGRSQLEGFIGVDNSSGFADIGQVYQFVLCAGLFNFPRRGDSGFLDTVFYLLWRQGRVIFQDAGCYSGNRRR